MEKILEIIMNFINENTTLLIIICIFLIFVLIGYLIDNSIKTKKLEIERNNEESNNNVINEDIPDNKQDTNGEVKEEPKVEEIKEQEEINVSEVPVEETSVNNAIEESEIPQEENQNILSNEITVDSKVNDMLLRDFNDNGISNIELPKEDVPATPVEEVTSIENVLNNDSVTIEPVKTSPYKNDKKLSDILKKKDAVEEPSNNVDELDRILKKLNDNNPLKDNNLEETVDFTNMF